MDNGAQGAQLRLQYEQRLKLRHRGRPRSASDEIRDNNYRDDRGVYALTDGLKHWHARIVDFMLLNPNAKIKDVALQFNVTPSWVGILLNTDAFKEYYQQRMREYQELINVAMVSKLQGVAVKALGALDAKIDKGELSTSQLLETTSMTTKALGFGVPGVAVQVNNNTEQKVVVLDGTYANTMQRARELIAKKRADNSLALEADGSSNGNYSHITSGLELNPTPASGEAGDEAKGDDSPA